MARAILIAVFLIGSFVCPISAWETEAAIDPVLRIARRDSVEQILERGRSYNIVWRSRTVNDQRARNQPQIAAEMEWLWRWDRNHPRNIFPTGFVPRVNFGDLTPGVLNPATDLQTYVAQNIQSVFVGTTRRNWAPRARANTFRYDIFAPGGIDINRSVGEHIWQNQMEVAFFGGIRTEFIYGAVELDRRQRQIRYHLNPFYRGQPDPLRSRRTRYCRLPVERYRGLTRQQQNYCVTRRSSFRKKRNTGTELMRTSGSTLIALSDCSYWYKVNVEYLNFNQYDEVGEIEPYGSVSLYTSGNDDYESSVIWKVSPGSNAPSVVRDSNLYNKGKCLVVQSDTNLDPVKVCFKGNVKEYDPATGDDEIARRFSTCFDTHPISKPSKTYDSTFYGDDGKLILRFTVTQCGEDCLKNKLNDNSINGNC